MIENKKNTGQNKNNKNPKSNLSILLLSSVVLLIFGLMALKTPKVPNIDEYELKKMVLSSDVESINVINDHHVDITLKKDAIDKADYQKLIKDKDYKMAYETKPHFRFEFVDKKAFLESYAEWTKNFPDSSKIYLKPVNETDFTDTLLSYLPLIIIILFAVIMMRRMAGPGGPGGQIFNIGKSRAALFDAENKVKITFSDVAGLQEAKEEIREIVDFLKNPTKYTKLGGKIPKGALLVGPPGTGKTLLAKAVAGEAGVPFFSLSGSDFVEMFVGVGAARVRDLFKQAKEKAPCIIFIDEIDAVGRSRGKGAMPGGNDERENTLNSLLVEMDGFGTDTNVIVLAATNRADVLDKALLRAGRFDRQIFVDLPDIKERKEIFEVHLKNIEKSEALDTDFLAKQTPGFSGAEIANVCNEAALIAARKDKKAVDKQDFLDAVDRIIGGLEKKNKIISPDEKHAIAIHEAGHATVSWMLQYASPLVKVTIVPRGQSLGAAWYLPTERQIVRTEQILDEMCATMGGRAAEKVVFNKISTGALSDLEKVTKQAKAIVTVYGLNDKLGNVTYYDSSGQSEYTFGKPYSENTAILIDQEISKLIEEQYQRAILLLEENRDKLEKLASILIEKEVIFRDDLEELFGKRPFDKEDGDETSDKIAAQSKGNLEEAKKDLEEEPTKEA
jgi:cell division protease FtsH